MEDFSSTGQLVTLGLVDGSIGAMAKGLALVDVEALVVKDMLLSLKHLVGHCVLYSYCFSSCHTPKFSVLSFLITYLSTNQMHSKVCFK